MAVRFCERRAALQLCVEVFRDGLEALADGARMTAVAIQRPSQWNRCCQQAEDAVARCSRSKAPTRYVHCSSPPHMKLIVRAHVLDDDGEGARSHAFTEFPIHIGRDEGCDLRVRHRRTSRRHARIERVDDCVLLVDEGSRNGVFVNGERIAPYRPVRLLGEARVALGPVTVMLHVAELTEPIVRPGSDAVATHLVGRSTELSYLPPDMAFREPVAQMDPPSSGSAVTPRDTLKLPTIVRVDTVATGPRAMTPYRPPLRGAGACVVAMAALLKAAAQGAHYAWRFVGALLRGE
jgi:hypothetical protein